METSKARSAVKVVFKLSFLLFILFLSVITYKWPCFFGYFFSIIVGTLVTYLCSLLFHWLIKEHMTDDDVEPERVEWIPMVIGLVERAVYTSLVAFSVSGSAAFIIGWVAVKSAVGWQIWRKPDQAQDTLYSRSILFIVLLNNAISILFGLIGGLMIDSKLLFDTFSFCI